MLHKQIAKLAAAAGVMALLAMSSVKAETVATDLRNELRHAVETYIDANSTDGKLLFRSPSNDDVMSYDLSAAYTLVVKVGERFVMCSSFQTSDGKTSYMDFLIERREGKAQVIQVFAGRRSVTREMVEAYDVAKSAIAEKP